VSTIDFAVSIFNALAVIPQLVTWLESFAAGVVLWYVNRANGQVLKEIADAAALASRAHSKEERLAALRLWRDALAKPRVLP
jgi:hypothetical protein